MILLFPQKLHNVLGEGKYESIISWQCHGRAFKVHKREEFVKTVLPLFAKSGKTFASFARQLNYYGFKRCDIPGPDKGSYYHSYFLRDRFDLCRDYMSRKQTVVDKKQKKLTKNDTESSSTTTTSGIHPKAAAKGEVGNASLIFPLAPTATNPVSISKPFHEVGNYYHRSQWNIAHGKYPKSHASAADHQNKVSRHLCPPAPTPYSQLPYHERKSNLSLPSLERECDYDVYLNQHPQGRYPHQYPNSYSYHYDPTSSKGITNPYTSSNLQTRYQQELSKGFVSTNNDHYYKEQRQDYHEEQMKKSQIEAQIPNHKTMMRIPPTLKNKNEKDINYEYDHQKYATNNISTRSTVSPQNDVSEGDSIQHERRDERNFSDHFHATDIRLETIQRQDSDVNSTYTPRASDSRASRFWHWHSSGRQVSYDAVNDLVVGEKGNEEHPSIAPVPDRYIIQALYNNEGLNASASEEDLMQMSFSFP